MGGEGFAQRPAKGVAVDGRIVRCRRCREDREFLQHAPLAFQQFVELRQEGVQSGRFLRTRLGLSGGQGFGYRRAQGPGKAFRQHHLNHCLLRGDLRRGGDFRLRTWRDCRDGGRFDRYNVRRRLQRRFFHPSRNAFLLFPFFPLGRAEMRCAADEPSAARAAPRSHPCTQV